MQLKLSLKGPVEPSSASLLDTQKLCPADIRNYLESSQHQITVDAVLVEHMQPELKNFLEEGREMLHHDTQQGVTLEQSLL